MKKILLITYAFSPISSPESILSAKLFANLKKTQTDVVTIDYPIPGMIDLDPSLEHYINLNFNKIYRCQLSNLFKFFCYFRLKKMYPFPDFYQLLNNSIYEYIKKNININKYDHIITWSQSHSIHLVGLKLKFFYNLNNWTAYFSDPWADNPFFNKAYFGLEKFLNQFNEKKVVYACKKVICTSLETKNLMLQKYEKKIKNKFYVIPHSFDIKLYPKLPKINKKTENPKIFKFRYLGRFYGNRFPLNLIEALKIIEIDNIYIFKKIRVEIYGAQNFLINLKFTKYKKYINLMGPISYTQSLYKMQTADFLLVIDAPFKRSVFFPSKLVDYIGSGKKVIGITPNGTAKKIIKKLGGYTLAYNDKKKLASQLIKIVESGSSPYKANNSFIKKFLNSNVGELFLKTLEK